MKFTTLALLGLPGALATNLLNPLSYGSFSEPVLESAAIQRRSSDDPASAIIDALQTINNDTLSLNTVLGSFSVYNVLDLQSASLGLVSTILGFNQTIAATTGTVDGTNTTTVLAITNAVTTLQKSVNTTVQTTINQKQNFGGVAPVVLASLQQQYNATVSLTLTINSKLPSSLAAVSGPLTAPVFASLNLGISIFETPNVNPSSVYASTGGAGQISAQLATMGGAALVAFALFLN